MKNKGISIQNGEGPRFPPLVWVVLLLLLLSIGLPSVSALEEMTLKKEVDATYQAGDDVHVTYIIENPFNTEITGIFTDTSVMGEQGYKVECLQLKIPPQAKGRLDLSQQGLDVVFPAPDEGEYKLGNATFTYRHPELDIIVDSSTDSPTVTTRGSSDTPGNVSVHNLCSEEQKKKQQQQKKQKKGQQSREEAQKERQEAQDKIEEQQKEMQEREKSRSEREKKVSQAQSGMNANTQLTKEIMQKALERKRQQEQSMDDALKNCSRMQNAKEKMRKEGYQETNKSFSPQGNRTGDFEYQYENSTGGRETLKGKMKNGSVTQLASSKKMKQQLQKNEEYQKLQKKLRKKGFEPKEFNPESPHSFSEKWEDENGNTQTIHHDAEKNLTRTDDFRVESQYQEEYLLNELSHDARFEKIQSRMTRKGMDTGQVNTDGPTSYVTFRGENQTRKVYFSEPEIKTDGLFETLMHRIQLGWAYLLGRG